MAHNRHIGQVVNHRDVRCLLDDDDELTYCRLEAPGRTYALDTRNGAVERPSSDRRL